MVFKCDLLLITKSLKNLVSTLTAVTSLIRECDLKASITMKWKEGQMSEGKEASRKVFFEKLYTYPQKQVQNHLLATEMGFAVTSEVCLSNTFFQG